MKILTGSNYFFNVYKDFKSKDIDYIYIIDPKGEFKYSKSSCIFNKECVFYTNKFITKQEVLDHYKTHNSMTIAKFLTKEFAEYFNITIEDLKTFQPLVDNLDDKHLYLKIIYNSYIENNEFNLTDIQRDAAYKIYKKYRNLNG